MKKLRINKLSLKTFALPLLALSLIVGCAGLLGGSVSAASVTISSTITNSTTDDPNVPSLGVPFSDIKSSGNVPSIRFGFADNIQSAVGYDVHFMAGRVSEPCSGAVINKVMAAYDAKVYPSGSNSSEFALVAFYANGSTVDVSSVSQGGSTFGVSGVGGIFGMPVFDQTGVVAEWNNLNIPFSQSPGIAVSVAGHDSEYVTLDNLKIEVTYDNSACSILLTTDPDTSTTLPSTPVTINVLGNDSGTGVKVSKIDNQDIVIGQTITLTNGSGTVKLNTDGTITFTPASTFQGESSFSYSITDGTSTVDTGAVKITVASATAPEPVTPSQNNPASTTKTNTANAKPMLANTGESTKTISLVAGAILSLGVYLKVKSGKRSQDYIKR